MKYIHLYALFLVVVFHSSCGQKQTNSPGETIKSENKDIVTYDWPGDTVIQIKKGSNGTILIAAMRGVFRYDGKTLPTGQAGFTDLTNKLGSHKFQDVLEDRKGNLWLASDSGVYYYPSAPLRAGGKTLPAGQAGFQHFTTRDGLADNDVICIYEDKAGIIWFGTRGGASRYDGISFRNFIMKGEYRWDTFITTFMEDKTGKLWISTRADVSIYDGETFTTLPNKSDRAYDIFSMTEDKKGNIWLGGWDGLRRYDGKTFTKIAHNKGYNFIIEDKKGNIWTFGSIGNSIRALSRYDQKSLYNKDPIVTVITSGPYSTFSGILEADDGSIWFGYDGGLYRYDGKTITDFKSAAGDK
ncbi:ligand-binding sensor domain-containing protein [Ferruginibacter sp.]|nr:histidine kinase [Ferruginibacter sp.]